MTTSGLKFLVCFISALLPICLQGQSKTISVTLKKSLAAEPIEKEQFYYAPNADHLTGIPRDLDTMMFWACPLSSAQFLYEQYQNGKFCESFDGKPYTKEAFERNNISPKDITDQKIKYKIYGISGLRKEKKIIVVDANNNGDLSDEIVMEFDTTGLDFEERIDYSKPTPPLVIHYEVFLNGDMHQKEKIVSIHPFVKLTNPPSRLFEDLKFSMKTNEVFSGELAIGETRYNIVVEGFINEGNSKRPNIWITEYGFSQDTVRQKNNATNGSILRLGKTWIRIDTVDINQNKLLLTVMEKGGPEKADFIAPPISMKDLNGQDFSLEKLKGKYVFMIFWGTWCGPCKADHPALKNIYEQYKSQNIEFVGVAVDASPAVVKDYLSKEKMSWTNLFVNHRDNGTESVVGKYEVNFYPLYFLINPAGEIILRGDLKNMQTELKEIFD